MDSLSLDDELFDKLKITKSFKREHYSPSFINSWNECPAKTFYSQFIDNKAVRNH